MKVRIIKTGITQQSSEMSTIWNVQMQARVNSFFFSIPTFSASNVRLTRQKEHQLHHTTKPKPHAKFHQDPLWTLWDNRNRSFHIFPCWPWLKIMDISVEQEENSRLGPIIPLASLVPVRGSHSSHTEHRSNHSCSLQPLTQGCQYSWSSYLHFLLQVG